MRLRSLLVLALTAIVCIWGAVLSRPVRAQTAGARRIDFVRDIRPILADNCFQCHGPDDKQRMADLHLDTHEGLLASRKTGAAVVPGYPDQSRLFQKITAKNELERMPPSYAGKSRLSAPQIELLQEWIAQGAPWGTHWAFEAPKRPAIPAVKKAGWVRNPIDAFILARLEKEGLAPSPEAGKTTLIRRLSFDLTGLPPAPEEVDAFLADNAPDAYEKLVDRLLQSPHYGERMAMEWLDLARYADTHGYHIDSHRDMWPWRDWLIEAFNRNVPYDQFVTWQLAGDLLANATREQRIATGFNRNHMINFEGGAIPEEYLVEYNVDRVDATSTAFMGLTMGCARCHDHKYDPIKQKEFYQFLAFFNNVPEKGLDGRKGNAEPVLLLTTTEQQPHLDELKAAIKPLEKELDDEAIAPALAEWEKTALDKLPEAPRDGIVTHYEFDGNLSDISGRYHHARATRGEVTFGEGPVNRSASLNGETQVDFGDTAPFDTREPFALAVWLRTGSKNRLAPLQRIAADEARRGWELEFEESAVIPGLQRAARLTLRLISRWPEDAIEVRTRDGLVVSGKEKGSSWNHVVVNYDGGGKAAGLKIFVEGQPMATEVLRDHLTGSIRNGARLTSGDPALGAPFKGQLDDLRIYSRPIPAAQIHQLAVDEPVRALLWANGPRDKRSKYQKALMREHFLTYDAGEPLQKKYARITGMQREQEELERTVPSTMVMEESKKPRETFVLARGDYRNKTLKVEPGVPGFLPPLPADAPRNRLGLARWLVDASHPLTARVAVNHYWQMYFGTGLVKTAEDFGSRGEPPSHPELLDWLATEFSGSGWDVRAMQRLIVTSAAYRQDSRATRQSIEKDPENRLLARGPRFRLPAELIRDNALVAAGLINLKIGGKGVFPYQPPGLWEEISFGDVYSAQSYLPSHGDDLYRRSMYIFWKRTSPPPALATFDAPNREKCTARRGRTNTPLQALVLMNDPTYVEAARALAGRVLRAGKDDDERLRLAFRYATARAPDAGELAILEDLAQKQLAHYRADRKAADQLLKIGESPVPANVDRSELAAWTTVASVILSLDETITKE